MGALGAFEDDRAKDAGKIAVNEIQKESQKVIAELEGKKSL